MSEVIKNKIRQLYQFLREANQIKLRPIRQLSDQVKVIRLAELPDHPAMQLSRPVPLEQNQEIPDTLLRVKRPTITRCPTPPNSLAGWLLPGWDIPAKIAECAQQQNSTNEAGETITIEFAQDEQRVKDFANWLAVRQAWVTPELIARKALRFFEVFYDIYSTFEKDSEQLEIMIADGHLGWRALSSIENQIVINHPILLKRVELRFNAAIPEFTVHETDRETELYNGLFVDLENVSAKGIKQRKNDLEAAGYHPFGWEDTTAFLKAFIQTLSPTQGEFLDAPSNQSNSNPLDTIPRLWRDPVLLLRKRITGIANAVDAIIDDIEQQEYFPPALAQITGTFDEWQDVSFSAGQENTELSLPSAFNEADILLSKEANKEQLQIIKRLHTSGSVIVQGPPGTGKTHTIGNIIGHLLSQGKSILVTAHTAKALRVLRDKVPGSLKPLCVSVLGSDQDARQQLEMSISSITERLTGESAETLLQHAALLEQKRKQHLSLLNELNHQLREALENEYKEIVVGDKKFSPSDAARFIVQHENQQQWIPGPLKPETTMNLSMEELAQLYALGTSFSAEEEKDVKYPLPELTELPAETQFRHTVAEYQHLLTCDLSVGQDYWQESTGSSAALEEIAHALEVEFSDDLKRHAWRPHAIVAGIHGETEREVWEQLITAIEKTTEANTNYVLALQHNPQLSKTIPIHQQKKISLEICEHLDAGGKLGFLQLATRSEWKQWIKDVSVTAGKPQHAEHFQALHHLAHLEFCRQALETPWCSGLIEPDTLMRDN